MNWALEQRSEGFQGATCRVIYRSEGWQGVLEEGLFLLGGSRERRGKGTEFRKSIFPSRN